MHSLLYGYMYTLWSYAMIKVISISIFSFNVIYLVLPTVIDDLISGRLLDGGFPCQIQVFGKIFFHT